MNWSKLHNGKIWDEYTALRKKVIKAVTGSD